MQVLSRDSLRVATDSEHFRIVQGRGTERVAFSTIMDALGIEQDRQIRAKSGKRFKQTPQLATRSWGGARASGAGVIHAWSRSIWLFPRLSRALRIAVCISQAFPLHRRCCRRLMTAQCQKPLS